MADLICAFDLGLNLGWAAIDAKTGSRVASGTFRLVSKKGEHSGARWERARRLLQNKIAAPANDPVGDMHSTVRVVYEKVRRHPGTSAAHVYGALEAALQEACVPLELEPEPIEVSTWKKAATGNGRAKQPVYVPAMAKHFDINLDVVKDEDQAAALGIGLTAHKLGKVGPRKKKPKAKTVRPAKKARKR